MPRPCPDWRGGDGRGQGGHTGAGRGEHESDEFYFLVARGVKVVRSPCGCHSEDIEKEKKK